MYQIISSSWLSLLIILPLIFCSCSTKYQFSIYDKPLIKSFPAADETTHTLVLSGKTQKYKFDLTIKRDNWCKIDYPTTKALALFIENPGWKSHYFSSPSFRRSYRDLLHKWGAKLAINDKPSTITILIEDDFTSELQKLKPVLLLKWNITKVQRGIPIITPLIRYLIGFGTGRVKITVAGSITTYQNEPLIIFSINAWETGMPMGGWNFRVLSSKYCMKLIVPHIAHALTEILKISVYDQPVDNYNKYNSP